MANSVHTYIEGNSFLTIYGSTEPCMYGTIVHIKELTPLAKQKWPWMLNKWEIHDGKRGHGHFDTLKRAKEYAAEEWPGCTFKTPAQYQKEN